MCVEIFFHEIWFSELGEHFQLFRHFLTVPDSVRYQRWRHLLALGHVNCLETTLESFLGPIPAQKCIYFVVSNGNSLPSE
jgi:hypothetical protein